MTREEAIERLKTDIYKYADFTENPNEDEFWMAFDMAIESLEQKPCEDAISRQAVIDVIERWLECSGYNEAERHIMRAVQSVLYDSPSVTPQMEKIRVANIDFDKEKFKEIMKNAPITILDDSNTPTIQPKTGHWIAEESDEMEIVGYYCSECDLPMETEYQTKFCPNCGTRMIEPQESE